MLDCTPKYQFLLKNQENTYTPREIYSALYEQLQFPKSILVQILQINARLQMFFYFNDAVYTLNKMSSSQNTNLRTNISNINPNVFLVCTRLSLDQYWKHVNTKPITNLYPSPESETNEPAITCRCSNASINLAKGLCVKADLSLQYGASQGQIDVE